MTFREKLAKEHPHAINPLSIGGCTGCPSDYGYEQKRQPCNGYETVRKCRECWDREIDGFKIIIKFKDF